MSTRAIVNVATGEHYLKGQRRLKESFAGVPLITWDREPLGCPDHSEVPYAFKAHALDMAALKYPTLLWMDACIVPGARPLEDLWQKIEDDGVWFANNGYSNETWTCEAAYPLLGVSREENREIKHVVATTFGVCTNHPTGRAFLDEYLRLAKNGAFRGPWVNAAWAHPNLGPHDVDASLVASGRYGICGPRDVRGHRHDQSAASVIAWRLNIDLTNCPEWFAYKGGETDKTVLIADGAY